MNEIPAGAQADRTQADRAKPERAKPLSRAERRASILDATIPLLMEHGRGVTSKQIAAAAGIAEGTVFRVFSDKDELISAAVEQHIHSSSIVDRITAISPVLSLEERIEAVVVLMQYRVRAMFGLMAALGLAPPGQPVQEGAARMRHEQTHGGSRFSEPAIAAISDLLLGDRERLSVPPRRAAQLIRLVTLSMTHPLLTEGDSFSASEITDLLVNGCLRHPDTDTHRTTPLTDPATSVTV